MQRQIRKEKSRLRGPLLALARRRGERAHEFRIASRLLPRDQTFAREKRNTMKSYQPTFTAGLFTAATIFAAVLLAPMNAAEAGPRGMSGRDWRAAECRGKCVRKNRECKSSCNTCIPVQPLPGPAAVALCDAKYGSTCIARCN